MRRITLVMSVLAMLLLARAGDAGCGHGSEVADAAMRGDRAAVRAALARKADVNVAAGRRHARRCTGPSSATISRWRNC